MVHAPSPTCACRQRFPGNLRVARRLRVLAQGTSDYATGQRLASFAAASLVLLNVAGNRGSKTEQGPLSTPIGPG